MFDLKYLEYLGNKAQTKWRDLALANLLLEVNILRILSVYKHVNHNHLNLGIYNILSLLQSGSANQLTNERGSSSGSSAFLTAVL